MPFFNYPSFLKALHRPQGVRIGEFEAIRRKYVNFLDFDFFLILLYAKKKQKSCYSGKQGYHTLKSQVVADQKSEQVICVRCEKGRVHDFRLWKESKIRLNKEIEILGDKGYQGIQKIHQNSQIPHKKKKKEKLSKEQKKANLCYTWQRERDL